MFVGLYIITMVLVIWVLLDIGLSIIEEEQVPYAILLVLDILFTVGLIVSFQHSAQWHPLTLLEPWEGSHFIVNSASNLCVCGKKLLCAATFSLGYLENENHDLPLF